LQAEATAFLEDTGRCSVGGYRRHV